MVGVVKWLRHRIVAPASVGSNPITHPILEAGGQKLEYQRFIKKDIKF